MGGARRLRLAAAAEQRAPGRSFVTERQHSSSSSSRRRRTVPCRAAPRPLCSSWDSPARSLRTGNNRKRRKKSQTQVTDTAHQVFYSGEEEEEEKEAGVETQKRRSVRWKSRKSRVFFVCFFFLFVCLFHLVPRTWRRTRPQVRRRIVLHSARTQTWIYLTNEFTDRRRKGESSFIILLSMCEIPPL